MNFDELYKSIDDDEIVNEDCCTNTQNFYNENGEIMCKVCKGFISNILNTPEWTNYSSDKINPTRCGMPVNVLLPESSVGSTIGNKYCGKTMNQIRKYQQYTSMPYKERSKYKIFNQITETCKKNNINTKIINEAHSLYSIINQIKISRGSNRFGLIAACVYYACKECNVPRSSKEIAKIFDINITVITKGLKHFTELMKLNKIGKERLNNEKCINPIDFIERFCDNFNFTSNDIKEIKNLCNLASKHNIISENTPPSFAAGCIFYYIKKNNIDITKKNISDVCNISEVTINKCYKKLVDCDIL